MNCLIHLEPDPEFVEVDPTGRYGRYNEILGKGASKTVYKAFDEYEGIEVAWNQVKLYDCLQSPEELERLYCEIHLLKTLKHENIMKFYTSWVDTANRNINFVTEMFTSGTLRQYRLKHKRVNIRALKHWCRQILNGLLFLHSHDPPVIHRDLKCDNIFVNGNQGEVKIGDLGLAAMLRKSHAVHCVGTPEFMAPEIYAEEYNELVDIYSFGMCILEMVTFEYPYSECSHPAQIYKKVISGKKPDALYKVEDPEIRGFVDKCLATVTLRLSARQLLDDPFLHIEGYEPDFGLVDYHRGLDYFIPGNKVPFPGFDYQRKSIHNSPFNSQHNGYNIEDLNGWECYNHNLEQNGIDEHFDDGGEEHDDEHEEESSHQDVTIKGKRREDGSIFLRLRISDNEGCIRNIYFPFDIVFDTALSVATEMVNEVDIIEQDVIMIANMIDGEIAALVPEWKQGQGIEENDNVMNPLYCHNCVSTHTSTGSLMNLLSGNNPPGSKNLQILQCLGNGCAAMHGRFEEVTYQTVDSPLPKKTSKTENCLDSSSHDEPNFWDQPESTTLGSTISHSSEEHENLIEHLSIDPEKKTAASNKEQFSFDISNDYEHEIHQELNWLKKKHQIITEELEDQQKGTQNSFTFRN